MSEAKPIYHYQFKASIWKKYHFIFNFFLNVSCVCVLPSVWEQKAWHHLLRKSLSIMLMPTLSSSGRTQTHIYIHAYVHEQWNTHISLCTFIDSQKHKSQWLTCTPRHSSASLYCFVWPLDFMTVVSMYEHKALLIRTAHIMSSLALLIRRCGHRSASLFCFVTL